jgi:hypothetical protein
MWWLNNSYEVAVAVIAGIVITVVVSFLTEMYRARKFHRRWEEASTPPNLRKQASKPSDDHPE